MVWRPKRHPKGALARCETVGKQLARTRPPIKESGILEPDTQRHMPKGSKRASAT